MTTKNKLKATQKTANSKVKNGVTEEIIEKDEVFLSDEDEFDFPDLDLDLDDDVLDLDPDDDDELDEDDLDPDDDFDSDDADDIFSDTAELENDPFAFIVELRQPALPTNKKMLMTAKEVDYKIIPAEESKYGNKYKMFTIIGEVKHPTTKELITIKETGTTKNASFVQKVMAFNNGTLPKSLSEIVGKKAVVTIAHNTDQLGNVWDNIDTVEPYNPSSKKKAK